MTEMQGVKRWTMAMAVVAICVVMICSAAMAQTRKVVRGTVTAVSNGVISVKQDTGGPIDVKPDDTAKISKLAPGTTDLKAATPATIDDVAVGDRVLISAQVADSGPAMAHLLYVMKAGDIQQKNAADEADWQKRGVGGLVKTVDPAAKTVTITNITASGTKLITIQAGDKTELMRYAADSVKFADAKPAAFTEIKVGDQLRARGEKSADGLKVTAEEIVTGSFRNISGQVTAINPAMETLTVKDLATKATVTVAITSNTDMHMLPLMVATRFAARLKGGAAGAGGPSAGGAGGRGAGGGGGYGGGGAGGEAGGGRGAYGGRSASSDLTQMIATLPPAKLGDLKVGDALMIAATASDTPNKVTAITLLGGVEPILTAAPSDNSMTLAPWSLGGGAVPE